MPKLSEIEEAVASSSHAHSSTYHDNESEPFSVPLLAWYDKQSGDRKMPWRREISRQQRETMPKAELTQRAYEVWVSETMCQQTQVATVIPYYQRWMTTFPTVQVLAQGDLEVVRGLWQGLGYYSRGSRLHAGAQKVVEDFQGLIPDDPKILMKEVPGIGPYTAAAICSIAFGKATAAVDGNVQRVISRVFAMHAPIQAKATLNAIAELAQALLPTGRPGEHNQALMDLGFSVCSPRNPKCTECPLASRCLALAETKALKKRAASMPDKMMADVCTLCTPFDPNVELRADGVTIYPMKKIRKVLREEETAVRILETRHESPSKRQVLVVQRPEKGLLAGQWEFVATDLEPGDGGCTEEMRDEAIRGRLGALLAGSLDDAEIIQRPVVRHTFSHMIRNYMPDSMQCDVTAIKEKRARWASRKDLETLHLGKAMRLIWNDHLADERRNANSDKGKKRAPNASAGKAKKAKLDDSAAITRFLVRKPASERQETVESAPLEASPNRKKRVIFVSDEDDA